MTYLSRLSARAYARLAPEQRRAVDELRYENPDSARRGELKTILGWQRTAEETAAYARKLIKRRLVRSKILAELGCTERHLRRLLKKVSDVETEACKPAPGLEKTDINDKGKGAGLPPAPERPWPVYDSDPFAYNFGTALRSAERR
jgi:hypothetical protein